MRYLCLDGQEREFVFGGTSGTYTDNWPPLATPFIWVWSKREEHSGLGGTSVFLRMKATQGLGAVQEFDGSFLHMTWLSHNNGALFQVVVDASFEERRLKDAVLSA